MRHLTTWKTLCAFAVLSAACLSPVSEEPPGELVPLPDGGFDLICGDGGVYGIGIEQRAQNVMARNGGPPVFSKACTHIRGTLDLSGEIDFNPYANVRAIEGALILGGFPVEELNLAAFSNLRFVQRLRITNTVENLRSLQGLNLEGVFSGGVQISLTEGLGDISALKSTNIRGGELTINQTGLESLNGLQGVTHVSRLKISNNLNLQDLSGLSNLTRVDGDVDLRNNPKLRGVDAFLNRLEVKGAVYR
jgi:hypothetical protein